MAQSAILLLYHGGQFYWLMKTEVRKKTTDLPQVTSFISLTSSTQLYNIKKLTKQKLFVKTLVYSSPPFGYNMEPLVCWSFITIIMLIWVGLCFYVIYFSSILDWIVLYYRIDIKNIIFYLTNQWSTRSKRCSIQKQNTIEHKCICRYLASQSLDWVL